MPRDPKAYLWDICEAADAIQTFIADIDLIAYRANPLIHSAVERKFEIIGEALNKLAKEAPDLARRIPEYAEVIAFRNQLIHGYAAIDHERVWRIAQISLPSLRSVTQTLLNELGSP
ncbi:MAG TPA: hypothetical protein DCO82_09345 [Alphaproteobacteria bacterium]|jgi:uncharacterized protein with HEPN domain|nr:hypothetical protein [Alphaproteobacteria bacterium]